MAGWTTAPIALATNGQTSGAKRGREFVKPAWRGPSGLLGEKLAPAPVAPALKPWEADKVPYPPLPLVPPVAANVPVTSMGKGSHTMRTDVVQTDFRQTGYLEPPPPPGRINQRELVRDSYHAEDEFCSLPFYGSERPREPPLPHYAVHQQQHLPFPQRPGDGLADERLNTEWYLLEAERRREAERQRLLFEAQQREQERQKEEMERLRAEAEMERLRLEREHHEWQTMSKRLLLFANRTSREVRVVGCGPFLARQEPWLSCREGDLLSAVGCGYPCKDAVTCVAFDFDSGVPYEGSVMKYNLEPESPCEFTLEAAVARGIPFGITFHIDMEMGSLRVDEVHANSVSSNWNDHCASLGLVRAIVRKNDSILCLNGYTSPTKMIDEIVAWEQHGGPIKADVRRGDGEAVNALLRGCREQQMRQSFEKGNAMNGRKQHSG